eukprot:7744095-Alexandrium_andersonii.AAC.1
MVARPFPRRWAPEHVQCVEQAGACFAVSEHPMVHTCASHPSYESRVEAAGELLHGFVQAAKAAIKPSVEYRRVRR